MLLIQEENQASPKSPQVGRRGERTGEETPEFNDLQPWTGDREDPEDGAEVPAGPRGFKPEKTANFKSGSGSQTQEGPTKSPNPDSLSGSEPEGKNPPGSKEGSETEDRSLIQIQSGPESEMLERFRTSEIQTLASDWRSEVEHRLNPGRDYRLNLESKAGPRAEKRLDAALTGEDKKKTKEAKTRGAKTPSLR